MRERLELHAKSALVVEDDDLSYSVLASWPRRRMGSAALEQRVGLLDFEKSCPRCKGPWSRDETDRFLATTRIPVRQAAAKR